DLLLNRGQAVVRPAPRGDARLAAGPEVGALALELSHAAHQAGEGLGDGVRQLRVLDVRMVDAVRVDALPVDRDGAPRVPDHGRVRRHVTDHDRARADLRALADVDRAQHAGAGADDHAVPDGRVALAGLLARAAERDALVHRHVLADLGRLPDHDAHAVVDEEARADGRAGVDLDACEEPGDLADQAGREP